MKKSIAVIGSHSFSGYHLLNMCNHLGYITYGISRYENDNIDLEEHLQADINKDTDKIKSFLKNTNPDYIVNISALAVVQTSWNHPGDYFRTNCVSISDIIHDLDMNKFIQISTPEVYGNKIGKESINYNPSTPYAISKAMFDTYLMSLYKNFNFPVSLVRPCNWFGPYQQLYKIIPKTIVTIKKKEKLYLDGAGKSSRNFIYVQDVCDAILKVANNGRNGEIYHITTDEYITIKKLIEIICKKMDYSYDKLVINRNERIAKDKDYNLDSSKIRKELGWKPKYTLLHGIDKTIEWIDEDWNNLKDMSLEYEFK